MSQKDKTFGLSSENHVQLRKLNKEFLLARNVCFFPICIPYNSHDSHKKDTNKGHILSAQWLELLPLQPVFLPPLDGSS